MKINIIVIDGQMNLSNQLINFIYIQQTNQSNITIKTINCCYWIQRGQSLNQPVIKMNKNNEWIRLSQQRIIHIFIHQIRLRSSYYLFIQTPYYLEAISMEKHQQSLFTLVKTKCQQLRITDYEGGQQHQQDLLDLRYFGALIAYYQASLEMRELAIAEIINSSEHQITSKISSKQSTTKILELINRQNEESQNQSHLQLSSTQQTQPIENTLIQALKSQCNKLKISMDNSYDNFNAEEKPQLAFAGLVAYYESEIEFKDKAIKQLLQKEDFKSEKLLQKEIELNIEEMVEQKLGDQEQEREREEKIEEEALQIEELKDKLIADKMWTVTQHEECVHISLGVWDELVRTINENHSLRSLQMSVLPQNFDQTFHQIINHYESRISQQALAFQQASNETKSLLTLLAQKPKEIIIQREQQREKQLQSQIDSLRQDLQKASLQVMQLTQENKSYNSKINDMRVQLETIGNKQKTQPCSWSEKKEIMRREIEALTLTDDNFKQDIEKLNSKLHLQIENLKKTHLQQITTLKNQLQIKQQSINLLTQQHHQKENQNKHLQTKSRQQLEELNEKVKHLENDKIEMKQQYVQKLQNINAEYEKEKESNRLKDQQIQKIMWELQQSSKKTHDQIRQNDSLKQENQELKINIHQLRNSVNQAQINIRDNNQSNQQRTTELETKLQLMIKQKEDKTNELEEKVKQKQIELSHYKIGLGRENAQRLQRQADLKKANQIILSREQQVKRLVEENTGFKTKITECEQKICEITQKMMEYQQRNGEHLQLKQHLQKDIQKMQMEKESLVGELQKLSHEKDLQIQLFKKDIQDKQQKINWFEVSITDLKRELEQFKQKFIVDPPQVQETNQPKQEPISTQDPISTEEPLDQSKLAQTLHTHTQAHPSHQSHISQTVSPSEFHQMEQQFKQKCSQLHLMEQQYKQREQKMRLQIQDLKSQVQVCNNQRQTKQAKNVQLELRLKQLNQQLNKALKSVEVNKAIYEQQVKKLVSTIEFLKKQIKQKQQVIEMKSPTRLNPTIYGATQLGYDTIPADEVREVLVDINQVMVDAHQELEKKYQQQIQSYQTQIQSYKTQIQSHQLDLLTRQQQIKSFKKESTQLKEKISQLELTLNKQSQQFNRQLSIKQHKISQLQSYAQRKQLELRSEKECFTLKQKSLIEEIQSNQKQIDDLKQDYEKTQSKVIVLQNVEKDKKQLQKKYQQLEVQVQQLSQKNQTITNMATQLQQLKEQKENLLMEVTAAKSILNEQVNLKQKIQQGEKSIVELTTKLHKQQTTVQHLSQQNAEKGNKIKKLQNQLKEKVIQVQKHKQQTLNVKKIYQKAKVLHEEIQKSLKKYGANLKQQTKYTEELKQSLSEVYQKSLQKQQQFQRDTERIKKLSKSLDQQAKLVIKPPNESMQIQEEDFNEVKIKKQIGERKQLLTFYETKFIYFWKKSQEQEKELKNAEQDRKELDIQRINNAKLIEQVTTLQLKIEQLQLKTANYDSLLQQLKAKNDQIDQLQKQKTQISHQLTQTKSQLQKAKVSLHQMEQELNTKKKYNNDLNENIKKVLHQKSQIQQQLPLLAGENNELRKRNQQLKLSDQQKEKNMKERFEMQFKQFKYHVQSKFKQDNARILEKFHHDKQALSNQIAKLEKYLWRIRLIVTRIFERSEDKIEIKASSIEEWIYEAEKVVEDEKRKVGGNIKLQKKNVEFLKRLGKISN